jgi:hypothetical protein
LKTKVILISLLTYINTDQLLNKISELCKHLVDEFQICFLQFLPEVSYYYQYIFFIYFILSSFAIYVETSSALLHGIVALTEHHAIKAYWGMEV